MAPLYSELSATYWFPNGFTQTVIGDFVYPEGGWNGNPTPYFHLVGSYAQQVCWDGNQNSCGFTGWLIVLDASHYQLGAVLLNVQMTPDSPPGIDVVATHLGRIGNDTYMYAWTKRNMTNGGPPYLYTNYMVVIDGMGNYLSDVEDVSGLFTWNDRTKFQSAPNGDVLWAASWIQWPASGPGGNIPNAPQYTRGVDTYNTYIIRMRNSNATALPPPPPPSDSSSGSSSDSGSVIGGMLGGMLGAGAVLPAMEEANPQRISCLLGAAIKREGKYQLNNSSVLT